MTGSLPGRRLPEEFLPQYPTIQVGSSSPPNRLTRTTRCNVSLMVHRLLDDHRLAM